MPEGIRDTSAQDVRIEQHHHRWRWLRWALPLAAVSIALILLISALATWLDAEASVSSDRIRTAEVSLGDLVRDLNVQGRVVAAHAEDAVEDHDHPPDPRGHLLQLPPEIVHVGIAELSPKGSPYSRRTRRTSSGVASSTSISS